MFQYHQIDPIALHIGATNMHWYGIMYAVGFISAYNLARYRLLKGQVSLISKTKDLEKLISYSALGIILGGRLGYAVFYYPIKFLSTPWEIFCTWKGGMSFHGGAIGIALSLLILSYKRHLFFFALSDFVVPLVPFPLALGRLGNFINGELWGKPTSLPWGMSFPQAGDTIPRHPSQLYEMSFEGFLLFGVVWHFSKKPSKIGGTTVSFLVGYGVIRFVVEFTREPDNFLGLPLLDLSIGQWLSLLMIFSGLLISIYMLKRSHE